MREAPKIRDAFFEGPIVRNTAFGGLYSGPRIHGSSEEASKWLARRSNLPSTTSKLENHEIKYSNGYSEHDLLSMLTATVVAKKFVRLTVWTSD